ncbi:MAG: 16S rRNA (adenine(1518)-N(6)/adenine(1519)-N(6))-dimethyltransferase RsmA [Acidiferrobacterales bacterium]
MIARSPRKRFGQHFLRDRAVARRIVSAFAPGADDNVVEIGPGDGVLTRELAPRVATLHALEIDRDLATALAHEFAEYANVVIHNADALEFELARVAKGEYGLRLIGNLPYNISTPLLFHLLQQARCIRDMCFMLQKEVVDRLAALPGSKAYGRLGVMVQWRCRVQRLFAVGRGAFRPTPQVDSAVVRLEPYRTPPVMIADEGHFAAVVSAAFATRRKMLRNALADILSEADMRSVGIDPSRRGETLNLREFAALANAITTAST